jgi:CDGSH-type Zn-finger protein
MKFKACPPEKDYYLMDIEEGKTYAWCSCGKSATQPFCDGAHSGTDFKPVVFKATESKSVCFCGCKKTTTGPFCDGTHKE